MTLKSPDFENILELSNYVYMRSKFILIFVNFGTIFGAIWGQFLSSFFCTF